MCLTIEIEKTKRGQAQRRDVDSIQTGTSFGYQVITGVVDLGCRFGLS